ncbi:MAG: GTPase HflX [Nitrososphaeraceae archaeon]
MITSGKRALLVTYNSNESIEEAKSLASAADYYVSKTIGHRCINRSKYGVGKGKAYELKDIISKENIDFLIIDDVLKPSQLYNLASLCKINIIDRERLILEIFERRASNSESRIQIKMAQLQYEMIRIREKIRLAKIGEQPGFYGLGKYDADVSMLDLKSRMNKLKKKLEKEEKRRNLYRQQRKKMGIPIISLIGYTSAGKTTLFNYLTGETKLTGQGLFTTLSTFTRSIKLFNTRILISDTVGFINKLPAYMIDAFKSTLNELYYSNLILLIIDISQTINDIRLRLKSSLDVLDELQIPTTKILYLLNKSDSIDIKQISIKADQLGLNSYNMVIPISAVTGYNINTLKQKIASIIYKNSQLSYNKNMSYYRRIS